MISEVFHHLSEWSRYDTWIVVTGALAAMACALPGNYLVLRRQSMMGDALSHTVLLGVVTSFLILHGFRAKGWISPATYTAMFHTTMFVGAVIVGLLTALLTEGVRRLGNIDGTAALGVVFTTMFALGLLLIRLKADSIHIDPDCVLYGTIETVVMETIPGTDIPRAAVVNGTVLLGGLLLLILFYKELRIAAFDPELATSLGINARLMHYGLMAATSVALIAAFESVGSILVIAMLIVPAATASLLTERLSVMIALSLVIAAASTLLGHAFAMVLPPVIFGRLGYPEVRGASTAGMLGAASGLFFLIAVLLAPRQGLFSRMLDRYRLSVKIVAEDILGMLYRREEESKVALSPQSQREIITRLNAGTVRTWLALRRLVRRGSLAVDAAGYRLTDAGRTAAGNLIRSHRLWETYMAKHFAVPESGLHAAAERVEHYIDSPLREELADELDRPEIDPQGKAIPASPSQPSDAPANPSSGSRS